MSLHGEKSFKMKMREVENAFRHRRIPYPKRSIEIITLLAVSCTLFLFFHTSKLNSRIKEMEEKIQPSEFSALGLTGNHINSRSGLKHNDVNTLQGTYQYLKSTGQLGNLDPNALNNTKYSTYDLLLFNRVPKVGSETLIELIRRLSTQNDFTASRAPFKQPVLSRLDTEAQEELADEIIEMGESHAFSMHFNYIDFEEYNLPKPIYINLIRDPIERIISWFYYRRAPWSVVKMYQLTKTFHAESFYKKDFGRCVQSHDPECIYEQSSKFQSEKFVDHRRQTLFFCGHEPTCEPFNSNGALERAMRNVELHYAVVGTWENLNVTLSVLEYYIPRYFRDVTQLYYDSSKGLAKDLRNTNPWKPKIGDEIRKILRKNFTREYEFYNFCDPKNFHRNETPHKNQLDPDIEEKLKILFTFEIEVYSFAKQRLYRQYIAIRKQEVKEQFERNSSQRSH